MVLGRVLYLNSPEMHYLILGFLFSAVNGMVFPAYSIFFGEILEVSNISELKTSTRRTLITPSLNVK